MSALDEQFVILAEDHPSSGEEGDNLEWPYWQRSLTVLDMESGKTYGKDDWVDLEQYLNIVPMNGEADPWSRYHRTFQEIG